MVFVDLVAGRRSPALPPVETTRHEATCRAGFGHAAADFVTTVGRDTMAERVCSQSSEGQAVAGNQEAWLKRSRGRRRRSGWVSSGAVEEVRGRPIPPSLYQKPLPGEPRLARFMTPRRCPGCALVCGIPSLPWERQRQCGSEIKADVTPGRVKHEDGDEVRSSSEGQQATSC